MSPIFRLSYRDLLKGLIMAFIVAALRALMLLVQSKIETSHFHLGWVDLLAILNAAIVAALGYLIKQLSTDENGKILGKL